METLKHQRNVVSEEINQAKKAKKEDLAVQKITETEAIKEIEAALQAHAAWRKRFRDYLYGHATFDPDAVSATDQCDFGRWLDREGHRLMPGDLHQRIRDAHGEFHRIAVLDHEIDFGRKIDAEIREMSRPRQRLKAPNAQTDSGPDGGLRPRDADTLQGIFLELHD